MRSGARHPIRFALAALIAAHIAPTGARAEPPGTGLGNLADLFLPRPGTLVQHSSRAREPGKIDGWEVPAGRTVTLVDHEGPGVVRRWWMTVIQHEKTELLFRHIILRCYWDGETEPSVEVPLSDFFGLGFGEWRDYVSLPVSATSGGFNCAWPMPFHKSARITAENRGVASVTALYFNIGIETGSPVPARALYFHAQFRRAAPTIRGVPVTVLEASGSGQFVGLVLSARTLRGLGQRFLEGNEEVYIDGERAPSIAGTGTEDYFGAGLYGVTGTFHAPDHGITVLDPSTNRFSGYRWHINDPIPFRRSIKFLLQHGQYENETIADYATVAFWYQTHPHAKFPPFPKDLVPLEPTAPFRVGGLIEGESLVGGAITSGGSVRTQPMAESEGAWSGDAQLLWLGAKVGEHLTLPIEAPESGAYSLTGYFTRSKDYGDVRVLLAGRELALIRGYSAKGAPSGPIPLGRVRLEKGRNLLLLEIAGKDARATGYVVGIDGFLLEP